MALGNWRLKHIVSIAIHLRIDILDCRGRTFSYMQKSDKRLVILVTNEEITAIDDFRSEARMRNRSDVVRALLKPALDQIFEKILQQSYRDHLRHPES